MDLDLGGKNALVCGASRGIGAAVARALATLGANVTAVARNHPVLQNVVDLLPVHPGQTHRAVELDLLNEDALSVTAHSLSELPIHILVNNSGGPAPGPVGSALRGDFILALRQHLLANHALATILAPAMAAASYGRIVNIISTSVKEPITNLGVSNTVRAAVASWAKTLASELGPSGVTVNNVLPGYTRTERLAEIFTRRSEQLGVPVAEVERRAAGEVPLGRFAEPAEIANAVAFLASPAAAYVSGTNLIVDGGRTRSL